MFLFRTIYGKIIYLYCLFLDIIFTKIIIIFQDSSSDGDGKGDLEVRLREKALESMKKGNKGRRQRRRRR